MLDCPRGTRGLSHVHGFFIVGFTFYIVVAEAETESLGHFWMQAGDAVRWRKKGVAGGRSGKGGWERSVRSEAPGGNNLHRNGMLLSLRQISESHSHC